MTDTNQPAAAEGAPTPQFALQRIYLKDLSFESPLGVEAFQQNWQPKINQDLNTTVSQVGDEHYEVVLKITINATVNDRSVFLVEVQQAGLFMVKKMEQQEMAMIFNTMCPAILFPYVRETVDSCLVKGSFPALAMPPINFDALFFQAVQQAQQAQVEKESAGALN
jgi:preprotein translocase subunit SecB